MAEENLWRRVVAENSEHSRRYIQRFRFLAAGGMDLGGEARMIDAMVGSQSASAPIVGTSSTPSSPMPRPPARTPTCC